MAEVRGDLVVMAVREQLMAAENHSRKQPSTCKNLAQQLCVYVYVPVHVRVYVVCLS